MTTTTARLSALRTVVPWSRVVPVIRLLLSALLLALFGLQAQAAKVGSTTYVAPDGWTASVASGMATLAPSGGVSAGLMLVIPDQKVSGEARTWFTATVKQLSSDGQVTDQSDVTATTSGGVTLLAAASTVKLAQTTQYRFYTARLSGTGTATVYVLVTPTLEAFKRYQTDYVSLIRSAAPATASGGAATGSSPAGGPLSGTKTALPAVKPMNAAQFIAAGGNPEVAVIPDEFRCYQEKGGSSLTPELTVQILSGGKYRTAYGSGSYTVRKDSSLIKTDWTGGPLDGAYGYLTFGNDGQTLSLRDVGEAQLDTALRFECYQRGPRENRQLLEFRLRTPAAASYPCTLTDGSGKGGGTLEILAGGAYRLGGQGGWYSADFRSDQDQDWSSLDFKGGLLDDTSGTYQEDAMGVRTLRISSPKRECMKVVKPTPIPRYGTAKAPAPPKGSGGLSGAYARWYPDPLAASGFGGCGGLCWDVYVFDKSGYVYTHEPDQGLDEADCTRTHPNGLPVCEVYRVQGGQLVIGQDKPMTLAKSGAALKIGGDTYQPLLKLDGLKLNGAYESRSFVGGGTSTVSGAFQTNLTLTPQGRFSRERSGGVSATTTDTGTNLGTVTGGVTVSTERQNSGTYRVTGYTLELTYGDGHIERLFAYTLPDRNGRPDLGLLRLGGSTYTIPDKK